VRKISLGYSFIKRGDKMGYDQSRIVELYLLKAEKFSTETAPNQKKYYLDVARWRQENEFQQSGTF